jgi:HK97 family phage prohead protease
MKFKDIKLQIKEVTEKGEFSGYASTFGNEDLGGDIIMPGAFSKTISEKQDLPILWGHNPREVIGVNRSMKEDAKGLQVTGQLVMDVQRAKEAHSLMREGAVKGLSIGFDSIVVDFSRYEKEGIRILKEIKLWEYSLTPFPDESRSDGDCRQEL